MIVIALVCLLQDAASGETYLEGIGKTWAQKLPEPRILGVYIGRKYLGTVRVSVQADGGTFSLTLAYELKTGGQSKSKITLGPKLELIGVEEKRDDVQTTLTVVKGKWTMRVREKGQDREEQGEAKPAMAWEPMFLPLFAMPMEPVTLNAGNGFVPLTMRRGQKVKRLAKEFDCIELIAEGEPPARWYCNDRGPVEFKRAGSHVRFRGIAETEVGKDLNEPLELTEPQKAVIAALTAVKKGDKDALLAAFELETFTRERVPEFATCSKTRQKEILESTRTFLTTELMTDEARANLPEQALIEDWFAMTLETSEKDGKATVTEPDGTAWKLSRSPEGKWLIIGIGTQ
jgi:hypothetical protein